MGGRLGGSVRAVVGDLDGQRGGLVADCHVGVCLAGVLEDVGQRLLHDPVAGQVDAQRQAVALAVDPDGHRYADLGHLGGELAEVGQAPCRALVVAGVAAQCAEDVADFGEGVAAGPRDRCQGLLGLGRAGVDDVAADAGLDRAGPADLSPAGRSDSARAGRPVCGLLPAPAWH